MSKDKKKKFIDGLRYSGEVIRDLTLAPLVPLAVLLSLPGGPFVVGLGAAALTGNTIDQKMVRYIEPTPIERSAINFDQLEPYKADAAIKLFDEMLAKHSYADKGTLTPDMKNEIKTEVASYVNRFEENHSNLVKSYAKYYFETGQEVPEVIAKTMANRTGWNYRYFEHSSGIKKFKNKYKTEDLYTELVKFSYKKAKPIEELLDNKNSKSKYSSMYKNLNDLREPGVTEQVHDIIKRSSQLLSNKQTGTPDMCAGLLMESLNRDVLNNILTNCSEMGIDVMQLFDAEKRKTMQGQHQIHEEGNKLIIDNVTYILPDETSSMPTIDGPQREM